MSSPVIQTHVDDISLSMGEWLRGAVPGVEIQYVSHFRAANEEVESGTGGARACVEICFHSITDEKPDRALLNRGESFWLTYLLRVDGADALANQRVYSEIYFAAHASNEYKIGAATGQSEPNTVGSFSGEPAVLSLSARLVRPAEIADTGIVVHPLNLKLRSMGRIAGKVVTETGAPIMRAEIDARSLNKRVVSDRAGRFAILGAPAAGTISLNVRARNRSVDVLVDIEKQAEIVIVLPKEKEHA